MQFEWNVLYKNTIPFIIYDWKIYKAIDKDEIINWSIGTLNKADSKVIEKALSELVANSQLIERVNI